MIKRKILVQYEIKRGEAATALGKINWNPDYGCTLVEDKDLFLSTNDMREILKAMEDIEKTNGNK